jgi:CPA1 family monovalent cation:H+ antiporter
MSVITIALLALALALGLIAFLVPVAERLRLPLPTVIGVVGLGIGILLQQVLTSPASLGMDQYETWLFASIALDGHDILTVFLPPLLFEMALAVNVRRLLEDLPVVILMAVVAVMAATLFVGGALHLASGLGLTACLLLGAVISTTDPAAVITIFRELGAPRRLLVILEGESLLNDAAAIALFSLLLASLAAAEPVGLGAGMASFLYLFGLGAAVGGGLAYLASWLYPLLRGSAAAEMTLSLALAYGAFLIAEFGFHASGVVAAVIAGLTTVVFGSVRMGPGNWPTVTAVWGQIGFWANALILLIGAVIAPRLMTDLRLADLGLLLVVVFGAFAARALVLFGMLPALSLVGLSAPVTNAQKTLIWWGGVRGAVTLVLTLSLSETTLLSEAERGLLGTLGCGFVLVTLLVNAASLAAATRWLGLDRLPPGDRTLRARIIAETMRDALRRLTVLAGEHNVDPAWVAELQKHYEVRVGAVEEQAMDGAAPFGERLRLGLALLTSQEHRIVLRRFEDGVIGPTTTRILRLHADRLADATRLGGRTGYARMMATLVDFPRSFRMAMILQRWLRFERPLAMMLARRFDVLFEAGTMLRELARFHGERMGGLIGTDAQDNLQELLDRRKALVRRQLEALELQYPHYAQTLRSSFLQRAGLRWEEARYARLQREGIVNSNLYRALQREVGQLVQVCNRQPRLDVGLDPAALLAAVPLFQALTERDQRWLRRRLRSRLTAPGDHVVRRGERGHEMYFIGSGVFEVRLDPAPVLLKTGDFFGEIAILAPNRRRAADVVALGFCRLLVLRRRDVVRLGQRNANFAATIRAAAAERLGKPLPERKLAARPQPAGPANAVPAAAS